MDFRNLRPHLWAAAGTAIVTALTIDRIGLVTADAQAYIDIANGLPALQPFANRAIVPRLAYNMASALHVPLVTAFTIIKIVACMILCHVVWGLGARGQSDQRILVLLIFSTPFVSRVYGLTFLPDMEFLMCCGLVIWAFLSRSLLALSLSLVLAVLVREVGLLIGAGIALSALVRRERPAAAAAIVGTVCGALLVPVVAAPSPGNMHAMPQAMYFILKGPVNFIANWLGIKFFTSTGLECAEKVLHLPRWIVGIAGFPGEVGVCAPDTMWMIRTWVLATAPLGALPLLAILAVRRNVADEPSPPGLVDLGLIGSVVWFVGTISGTWIDKLIAPAGVFAASVLAVGLRGLIHGLKERAMVDIVALNLIAGWLPLIIWQSAEAKQAMPLSVLAAVVWLAAQWFCYRIVKAEEAPSIQR